MRTKAATSKSSSMVSRQARKMEMMLNKQGSNFVPLPLPMNIFAEVESLNLPPDQYVVVGGGVLAAHRIRDTQDVDIVVTPQLFAEIKKRKGWREDTKPNGGPALYNGIFEVYLDVNCDSYQPTTQELIARAKLINGVPFISLDDLLLFKKGYGRPKDKPDIKLIEEALANKS